MATQTQPETARRTPEVVAPRAELKQIPTPWGMSDHVTEINVGSGRPVLSVDTPSHGGYYVPTEHLHRIPEGQQQWAAKWSGSRNWYEEDCCWAAVVLAFPEVLILSSKPDEARTIAENMIREYITGNSLE